MGELARKREKLLTIVKDKATELCSLDKRSLSLFRILLGISLLFDLSDRARDISAHYSDEGVLPRSLVTEKYWHWSWFSFHLIGGDPLFIVLIFLVNAVIVAALLIGYKSKLSSILSFLFIISLHNRNILVLHGGDHLIRSVMFFAMFLPLGEYFSVDAALKDPSKKKDRHSHSSTVFNLASIALTLQILIMYWSAHNLKTGKEWTKTYTASWLALQLDFFRRPFGDLLLKMPMSFLQFFTWAVVLWQGAGIHIYMSPFWTGPLRVFVVLGYFTMHFSFAMGFRLGLFSFITCSTIMVLLPPWFWDSILALLRNKSRSGLRLYYLRDSPFSSRLAQIASVFCLHPDSRIVPLSSTHDVEGDIAQDEYRVEVGGGSSHLDGEIGWFVEDHDRRMYKHFEAIVAIAKVSPLFWPLTPILEKNIYLGNKLLDTLSSLAPHVMQNQTSTLKPSGFSHNGSGYSIKNLKTYASRAISIGNSIMAGFFITLVIMWTCTSHNCASCKIPENSLWIMYATHLDQNWAMFTPRPPDVQWWYNIEGTLDNGNKVELFNKGALFTHIPNEFTWDKPSVSTTDFKDSFKNHRWFKYFENGYNTHAYHEALRLDFGRWLCREHNNVHEGSERLWKFSVHWMNEYVDVNTGLRTMNPKQTLWNHVCFNK